MIAESVLFWTSVILLFHTYLFFPVIISFIAMKKDVNNLVHDASDNSLPSVSILIAAYNEEKVIEQRIHEVMLTDYPAGKYELLIGSDGSTDLTNEILQRMALQYPQLHIFFFEGRMGKGNILNNLVLKAQNEICIFSDANILFTPGTIFQLVKHFKNPEIGIVGGNICSTDVRKDGISAQENMFITQEMLIKHNEGKIWGAMMGAYGACYALRKVCYVPIPVSFVVDDFYITLKAIEKGRKSILEMEAVCYEHIPNLISEEFRRKVRIATGNFQNFITFLPLMFRGNGIGFCYVSHKVIRWFGPILLICAFISNLLLFNVSIFYSLTMFCQIMLLLIPLIDYFLHKIKIDVIILRFITHFYSMNFALLVGFCKYLKGVKTNVWEPTTREH